MKNDRKRAQLALPLPAWPTLLDEATACAYLSVGEGTFRAMCAGAGVRPVNAFGMRITRWRRSDLDALVDKLPPRGTPGAPNTQAFPMDETEAALSRVAARRRKRA